MKGLSLEETMNGLKARLEESEYKYAIVCEALEWVADCSVDYQSINKARQALHEVSKHD